MLENFKFICPYCQNDYLKDNVIRLCERADCKHYKEAIKPNIFGMYKQKCNCRGSITRCRCYECSQIIPRDILDWPYIPFSIVGTTSSGKSSLITVMMDEFGYNGLGLTAHPLGETSEIQDTHKEQVYYNRERLMPTDPEALTPTKMPEPQIWKITNGGRKKSGFAPSYTFTIFDGAGEHSQGQSPENIVRYIGKSKAMIVTIDPLTINGISKNIDIKVRNNTQRDRIVGGRPDAALANITTLIRDSRHHIGLGRDLDIPVAVVLTKFDVITTCNKFIDMFKKNAPILNPAPSVNDRKVDIVQMKNVSDDIVRLLEETREHNFVQTIKNNFKEKNVMFFGVSSYGRPPKDDGTLHEITPHKVLDPLLWLLKKMDFVD